MLIYHLTTINLTMKKIHRTPSEVYTSIYVISLLFLNLFVLIGCSKEAVIADSNAENQEQETPTVPSPDTPDQNAANIDVNNDGTLNILILGSSKSINSTTDPFRISELSNELNNIFIADPSVSFNVKIAIQDIYTSKDIVVGLGGQGTEYTYTHFRHSLTQFYHWPEGKTARLNNLSGQGDTDWDYVIITADPYIVQNIPGYFALGVNKLASKIEAGKAKTLCSCRSGMGSPAIRQKRQFKFRISFAQWGLCNRICHLFSNNE